MNLYRTIQEEIRKFNEAKFTVEFALDVVSYAPFTEYGKVIDSTATPLDELGNPLSGQQKAGEV